MDHEEDYLLAQNKHIEHKLDHLFYLIESRLDKVFERNDSNSIEVALQTRPTDAPQDTSTTGTNHANSYSSHNSATFKAPYIRDFRGFSAPVSQDVHQIQQLAGAEDINQLIKTKSWSKDREQQLEEAVLEHYASSHMVKLIQQKNRLLESPSTQDAEDVAQKLRLIDEQMKQVRARKEPKIFVPEERLDTHIDWCAISAKLTNTMHDARDCRLIWTNRLHWAVNDDKEWTKDEDICLINAVAKHGKNSWDRVAKELNTGRLAWQCCARYNQEYAYVTPPTNMDDTDKIIEVINLCRIGNYVPWNQVMYFIQCHNLQQVKYQWHKYCSERRSVSNWTPEENLALLRAVRKYGERDWCRIAACLPGRTNKSCRERYIMRLKFHTRTVGKWTKNEDAKLMSLVERYGTNWSLISSHLDVRNCHQLRNRYELLKNNKFSFGPIKRRKFVRSEDGQFVRAGGYRRPRPQSEVETNQRLREIFSTYLTVNKSSSKSLTCRSVQDEVIYQSLVKVLCDRFLGRDSNRSLLELIISRAIDPKPGLLMPCIPTLRAYKAWTLQQDYLTQFQETIEQELEIDEGILQIIVCIFLWPAVLSRLKRPNIDRSKLDVGTLIEQRSKEFYKVRNLQIEITK